MLSPNKCMLSQNKCFGFFEVEMVSGLKFQSDWLGKMVKKSIYLSCFLLELLSQIM